MSPEERDALAAEFVIGTLPTEERARARDLAATDPGFAALIRTWEDRLAPLDRSTPSVDPSPMIWHRIEAQIAPASGGTAVDFRRRVRVWRGIALAASALAAGLAAVLVLGPATVQQPASGQFVAVVNRDAELPALIVEMDTAAGTVTVRPVQAEQPEGRSLELWVIPEGQAPRSLGVIDPAERTIRIAAERAGELPRTGAFAVSSEPPGGSPTGAPTGPVIYSGALIAIGE